MGVWMASDFFYYVYFVQIYLLSILICSNIVFFFQDPFLTILKEYSKVKLTHLRILTRLNRPKIIELGPYANNLGFRRFVYRPRSTLALFWLAVIEKWIFGQIVKRIFYKGRCWVLDESCLPQSANRRPLLVDVATASAPEWAKINQPTKQIGLKMLMLFG